MTAHADIDISENALLRDEPTVLRRLLKDHTTSRSVDGREVEYHAIIWATDDYAALGEGYSFYDEIRPDLITGKGRDRVIRPRVLKERLRQEARSKGMAEVFTPAWVCNEQNNLVDEAWFDRPGVFNSPSPADPHDWISTAALVTAFPEGKTWRDYVRSTRLEVACGEAPYITSRYDATTGEPIPLTRRVGLLDRKLRLVSENCHTSGEWLEAAREAYQSTYAFEWQGDNLLLAREALYYTYLEAYEAKFGSRPPLRSRESIAYIISWNVWQMDGLRCVVPGSCQRSANSGDLFGSGGAATAECPGCKAGRRDGHTGISCIIKDWKRNEKRPFIQLLTLGR